jgi:hypothetical protein
MCPQYYSVPAYVSCVLLESILLYEGLGNFSVGSLSLENMKTLNSYLKLAL